jgi:DNA-binding protein H-NS
MSKINGLDKMSHAQLLSLRDQVDAAIVAAKSAEKQALRQKLEDLAAKSGMSLAEVMGKKRGSKGKAAIKYRNPADPSQTWTGRGRKPIWLAQAEKKGQKLESFAV